MCKWEKQTKYYEYQVGLVIISLDNEWLVDEMLVMWEEMLIMQDEDITMQ